MTVRNALPFEFPFRWNALRRFFSNLPDEAVDYFDQRDRDLEDFLAGLGGGGGGTAEAFSYAIAHQEGAGTGQIVPLLADHGAFATPGVSLSGNRILIPSGVWLIGVAVKVYQGGQPVPTSGEIRVGAIPWSASTFEPQHVGGLTAEEADWSMTPPIIAGSNLWHVSNSPDNLEVFTHSDLNQSVFLEGSVWGVQILTASVTVTP